MSRRFYSRAAFAATSLTVALLLSYLSPVTADLSLSRPVWDFGSIEQGQTKTQKIVMTNSGDQPLRIEKIELPKNCSVNPSLDNTEIQPEDKLEVEFTFDSEEILGQIQQYAYIFPSGSDEKSIVVFTIKGEVFSKGQPRLRVSPQTWNFGTVTVGDKKEQIFICENAGTAELKIEQVQIYDTRFRVEKNITKQNLEPGQKADFVVSVTGKYQGRYDTDFYVKSNSAARTFTKISIKGFTTSKPRGLMVSGNFSSVTNNTSLKFEITRTDKAGRPETITVEKNSMKSFRGLPGPRPTRSDPADYTLTIKLVRPPIPAAKPAEEKPSEEKPTVPVPKPEKKPPEGEPSKPPATSPEAPPTKPEKPEPSEKTEPKEEKKPEEPKKEEKPAPPTPSDKKESEKPPKKPAPEPEQDKAPAPSSESAKSPGSEEPSGKSGDKATPADE